MPFLVERDTRHIPIPALSYQLSICDVPTRKHRDASTFPVNTALASGRALKSLHEQLQLERMTEAEIDDEFLADWVGDMVATVSDQTGRPLQRSTITNRIHFAMAFMQHANRKGLIDVHVDRDSALRLAWGVDHLYKPDGTRMHGVNASTLRRDMIRPILLSEWRRIAPALGPTPKEQAMGRDQRSCRPRVASEIALRDGLRACEVAEGLQVDAIMGITVTDPDADYELMLTRTKGRAGRKAHLRGHSILNSQGYARGERAACIAAAKARGLGDWVEPTELLVNGLGSGRNVGRTVQPTTLERDFGQSQLSIGMTVEGTRRVGDGRLVTVRRPLHSFHDLRHTAALWQLHEAIRRGDPDPVAMVQVILGHRRRSSAEVYLQPDRSIVQQVGDLMRRLIKGLADA
jgi:integrase